MITIRVDCKKDYYGAMELAKYLTCWAMSFQYRPDGEFSISDRGNLRSDWTISQWIEVEEIQVKVISIIEDYRKEPHHV